MLCGAVDVDSEVGPLALTYLVRGCVTVLGTHSLPFRPSAGTASISVTVTVPGPGGCGYRDRRRLG